MKCKDCLYFSDRPLVYRSHEYSCAMGEIVKAPDRWNDCPFFSPKESAIRQTRDTQDEIMKELFG